MAVRLPTRLADWRLMGRTSRLVLSGPVYAALSVAVAVAALTAFAVSQNVALVSDVVVGGTLPLRARLAVLLGLYPFLGTSFEPFQGLVLVLVAALFLPANDPAGRGLL